MNALTQEIMERMPGPRVLRERLTQRGYGSLGLIATAIREDLSAVSRTIGGHAGDLTARRIRRKLSDLARVPLRQVNEWLDG